MKNQIDFFATSQDLTGILDGALEQEPMLFAVAGLFETPNIRQMRTVSEISELLSEAGDAGLSVLAVAAHETFGVREVPQANGGLRYGVDQLSNPRSVVVRPGRLVDDRTLLAGQVGTASDDPASARLFSAFGGTLRKQFTRLKSYWVGPEALAILDSGGRLASTRKAPPEYDLSR